MYDILTNIFKNPGNTFSPIPFWFLNDDMDPDELVRQIGEFHKKGVDGLVINARRRDECPHAVNDDQREGEENLVSQFLRAKGLNERPHNGSSSGLHFDKYDDYNKSPCHS